jgi:TRAP-type C4-dicarboxylate transport system permease small subunit
MWINALWNMHVGKYTENLELPVAIFQFTLFGGFVLLALQFIEKIFKHYKMATECTSKATDNSSK